MPTDRTEGEGMIDLDLLHLDELSDKDWKCGVSPEAYERVYEIARDAVARLRGHTSDNAEDFLTELDSGDEVDSPEARSQPETGQLDIGTAIYKAVQAGRDAERQAIRERVEQVGSLVRADPDEEWTTGYHDAIADVLTAIQEDTDAD